MIQLALNFGDYIANPYGKGTGIVPSNVIRSNIENETATMYPAPIRFKAYRAPHQHLVLHCKLPSRTKKDVFYLYKAWWNTREETVYIADRRLAARPAGEPFTLTVYSNAPSLKVLKDGKEIAAQASSGEDTGVIWKFPDLTVDADGSTFSVVSPSGKTDKVTFRAL